MGKVMDTVECYDPVTDQWTEMKPMPQPRADHASCVCLERLFVSGGVTDNSEIKTECDIFW